MGTERPVKVKSPTKVPVKRIWLDGALTGKGGQDQP